MRTALSVAFMALLMITAGCHQVTEYQGSDSASLYLISSEDFQVQATADGFAGGTKLLSGGSGKLVLLSTDGTLYRIDLETLETDTSYTIGGGSGTGYRDAVIAGNGNLYVLGPGSQVIEVDLGSNSVVDNFTPGSQPGALAANPAESRIYFTDSADDYIGEIWTSSNHTGFTSNTYCPLADIIVEPTGGRHIVAAGSNDMGSLYAIWLDYSTSTRLMQVNAGSPASAIIPMTEDSVYAIACPVWSSSSGYVVLEQGYMEPDPDAEVKIPVEGHPVALAFNRFAGFAGYLCVLSRLDSGSSGVTVIGFHFSHTDPVVEQFIPLEGFARDIILPGNGEYIVVLTSD